MEKIICQEQEIEIVNDDGNTVAKIKIEALGNGSIVFVDNNTGKNAACIIPFLIDRTTLFRRSGRGTKPDMIDPINTCRVSCLYPTDERMTEK